MKIIVSIVAEIDEPDYPLSGLNDLLYALIDDLNEIEAKHRESVPLPLTRIKKNEGNKLTASIARATNGPQN